MPIFYEMKSGCFYLHVSVYLSYQEDSQAK